MSPPGHHRVRWVGPGGREKLETGPTPKESHPGSAHFLWKDVEVQMHTTVVFVSVWESARGAGAHMDAVSPAFLGTD